MAGTISSIRWRAFCFDHRHFRRTDGHSKVPSRTTTCRSSRRSPRLRIVTFDVSPSTDRSLQTLSRFREIELVGLNGTRITDKGLASLAGLPRTQENRHWWDTARRCRESSPSASNAVARERVGRYSLNCEELVLERAEEMLPGVRSSDIHRDNTAGRVIESRYDRPRQPADLGIELLRQPCTIIPSFGGWGKRVQCPHARQVEDLLALGHRRLAGRGVGDADAALAVRLTASRPP